MFQCLVILVLDALQQLQKHPQVVLIPMEDLR
jgi:hypothetical protein